MESIAKCFKIGFTTALLMCSCCSFRFTALRTSGRHVLQVSFLNALGEFWKATDVYCSIFTKLKTSSEIVVTLCMNEHEKRFNIKHARNHSNDGNARKIINV